MYFCEPVLLLILFVSMLVVMIAPKKTDMSNDINETVTNFNVLTK